MDSNLDNEIMIFPLPPVHLRSAAEDFVATKAEIDDAIRGRGRSRIIRHLLPRNEISSTMCPSSYARLLPFFNSTIAPYASSRGYKTHVPTQLVIGDSWRWTPESLSDDEKKKIIQLAFADFHSSTVGTRKIECADYWYVRPLGFVIASEGKNRVALFRKSNLPHIPAIVHERDYPVPSRIKVFEIGKEWYASLDDAYITQVTAPHVICDLLEAYGVKFSTSWPEFYPPLDHVRKAFEYGSTISSYGEPVVEISPLRESAAIEATAVKVPIFSVAGVATPSLKTVISGGALSLVLLVCLIYDKEALDLSNVFAFLLGAIMLGVHLLTHPLVRCRIDKLKERDRLHYRHQIRRHIKKKL